MRGAPWHAMSSPSPHESLHAAAGIPASRRAPSQRENAMGERSMMGVL